MTDLGPTEPPEPPLAESVAGDCDKMGCKRAATQWVGPIKVCESHIEEAQEVHDAHN